MRPNKLIVARATLLLSLGSVLLFARSSGADPFLSGAPSESTCSACHGSGTPNVDGGNVKITFPTTGYTAGSTYKILVTITDATAQRWGFEITARSSGNVQAGTFAPSDSFTRTLTSGSLIWETHTSDGTRPGTSGPTTFEMNWTAPASDAGDITFYVAANAADNSGSPSAGDHIYTSNTVVSVQSATALPQLRTSQPVLQAFSGMEKMSPGTWIELYGANLSATTRTWTTDDFTGANAPTQLDGVGVLIDNVPAYVSYVSPTQINVQVPNINTTGNATIVVTGPGNVQSAPITLARSAVSPALLAPASFKPGTVQYVAANYPDLTTFVGQPNMVPGAAFKLAKPDDYIILYAVGCGPTSPSVAPGQQAAELASLTRPVRVTIGGKDATIKYAGIYPPFVGLYRIDVIVPPVIAGDQIVDLLVDGVSTGQSVFLPVGQ